MPILSNARATSLIATILAGALTNGDAQAQALCSLRDPIRQITTLFPEADGYRSIVRVVDQSSREDLKERLPFTLHFNELGRHTLYVVQKQSQPLGLVHVRSEAGKWGLVEIAWALDFDLNILDYDFQRCRDRSKVSVLAERGRLHGMGFRDLLDHMNTECSRLRPGHGLFPRDGEELGLTVVRNALKTIAVTESAWKDDLVTLRAEFLARRTLGDVRNLAPLQGLFGSQSSKLIKTHVGKAGTGIVRSQSRAFACKGKGGKQLGRVVLTPWSYDDKTTNLRWSFHADGQILAIEAPAGWPSAEVSKAFEDLVGLDPLGSDECSGFAGLIATEVALAQRMAREPKGD